MNKNSIIVQDLALFTDACDVKIVGKNNEMIAPLGIYQLNEINKWELEGKLEYVKPILRTLDQITNEDKKEFNRRGISWDIIEQTAKFGIGYISFHYGIMLIKQGFDVFGWIEEGLAIKKE